MLSQYQYSIEYRKTSDHGNADALSRLPVGPDANFDGEEGDADVDTVCTIKTVSLQLNPTDPGAVAKESAKDPIISNVMRYTNNAGGNDYSEAMTPTQFPHQILWKRHGMAMGFQLLIHCN